MNLLGWRNNNIMIEDKIIKPKYELNDFLKLFGFKIIMFIAIMMVVFNIIYLLNIYNFFENGLPIFNIVFPIDVLIIFPITMYYFTKIGFNKNFRLKENITITINLISLREKGDTFDVLTPLSEIEKNEEKKDFFLIKYNKYKKGFLSKKFFSQQQLID